MEFKIDKDYTESAEKLLNKLYYHDYLFDSGISNTSSSNDIVHGHRELSDQSILTNLGPAKYKKSDFEKIRLFKVFTSNLIQTIAGSEHLDSLRNEVIKLHKRPENKNLCLFNLIAKIKTEKKRENRKKLAKKYSGLAGELLPNLETLIENRNQTAADLGFNDYTDQITKLCGIDEDHINNLCRKFLNDTEYIFRDLLRWHIKNKLEIQLEDAAYEDLLFLFNSFELKEYFKQTSALTLSTRFLDEIELQFAHTTTFDFEKRATKNSSPAAYPVSIPNQIFASIHRIKTIEDYEAILRQLGTSLVLSSVHIEESFVNKRLTDPLTIKAFDTLFENLIYKDKWLKKYIGIDTDKNFLEFLYLKKLFQIRSLCLKVISFRTIYKDHIDSNLDEISDNYAKHLFIKQNTNLIPFDLIYNKEKPHLDYKACLLEPLLSTFLINKFDEQWWRNSESGNKIMKWAENSSKPTMKFFEDELQINTINNTEIINIFEKVF